LSKGGDGLGAGYLVMPKGKIGMGLRYVTVVFGHGYHLALHFRISVYFLIGDMVQMTNYEI
jgi:hypothetical protein